MLYRVLFAFVKKILDRKFLRAKLVAGPANFSVGVCA